MARKAAAVAQTLTEEFVEDLGEADALTPEQRKQIKKDEKKAAEEALSRIFRRMAAQELPLRRSGTPPRYCVIPKGADPLIREAAESKGYAICEGEIEREHGEAGFSLFYDMPADVKRIDKGVDPSLNAKGREQAKAALERKKVSGVEMPGIPIEYVVFVQGVSLARGSVSMDADRKLDARIVQRGGYELSMGLAGPLLHIRTKKGDAVDYFMVPVTNIVKAHPAEGWKPEGVVEEKKGKGGK